MKTALFTSQVLFTFHLLFMGFSLLRCFYFWDVFYVLFTFQVLFTFHLLFMCFSLFRCFYFWGVLFMCFSLLRCVFHVLFTFQVLFMGFSLFRCFYFWGVLFMYFSLLRCAFHRCIIYTYMYHMHIHAPPNVCIDYHMHHMHAQLKVHICAPYTHAYTTKHTCHHQTPPQHKIYIVGLPSVLSEHQVKMRDLCLISYFCCFSVCFSLFRCFSWKLQWFSNEVLWAFGLSPSISLSKDQTADSTQISHFDLVFHRIHREGQLDMYFNFWQCLVVHLCVY